MAYVSIHHKRYRRYLIPKRSSVVNISLKSISEELDVKFSMPALILTKEIIEDIPLKFTSSQLTPFLIKPKPARSTKIQLRL